jgi:hypothetical protein
VHGEGAAMASRLLCCGAQDHGLAGLPHQEFQRLLSTGALSEAMNQFLTASLGEAGLSSGDRRMSVWLSAGDGAVSVYAPGAAHGERWTHWVQRCTCPALDTQCEGHEFLCAVLRCAAQASRV